MHITAHKAAVKVHVLHCDISPRNIMIVDNNHNLNLKDSMLIDWDHSKSIKFILGQAHQHTCTVSNLQSSFPLEILTCLATREHGNSWQQLLLKTLKHPTPWNMILNLLFGFWSGPLFYRCLQAWARKSTQTFSKTQWASRCTTSVAGLTSASTW